MRTLKWFLVALLTALTARAYVLYYDASNVYVIKWQTSPINLQIKLPTTRNLSDGTSQASCVLAAMDIWNGYLSTQRLVGTITSGSTATQGNGINEIVMASAAQGQSFGTDVLAVTLIYEQGDSVTETDMVFNTAYTWDSYRGALQYGKEDLRRVAIHELGHVLGLDHPDESGQYVNAIMNSHESNIDTAQADDITGVQMLYGAPGVLPTNDSFASATAMVPFNGVSQVFGSNIGATHETGEPNHASNGGQHSVWWMWTADQAGNATITTLGSNFDTVLAVYTGSSVSALTEVVSNDDEETPDQNSTPQRKRTSKVAFSATKGTTYYIAVDGWGTDSLNPTGYTGAVVVNLNLTAPPVIDTQPADVTVDAGSPAFFSVAAHGLPAPIYAWQRLHAGGSWTNLTDGGGFSGSTDYRLKITATVDMNTDQFRCVVSNSGGNVTSNAATLHVNPPPPPPVISTQPISQTVMVGSTLNLSVIATGSGQLTYKWMKNGAPLNSSSTISGTTTATLSISNAQASDSGVYTVTVSNNGGSTVSTGATIAVATIPGVISVVAGGSHTLFVCAGGQLWATGANTYGQLGDGTTTDRSAPVLVASDVVRAAAGKDHSLFIKSDRSLWAMGHNSYGELGDTTTTDRSAPVKIAEEVVAVSAGVSHTLFIKSDGTLWSAGWNYAGQLGDGTKADRPIPAQIATEVVFVAAGYGTSFFIKSDGTLWATGDNAFGQLGTGGGGSIVAPAKVASEVAAVSAADAHTVFIKRDGTLWAMGHNYYGELGDGTTIYRQQPVNSATGVVDAAAGGVGFTLFIKSDGSLWGVGDNGTGALGLPGAQTVLNPTQVATGVISVETSENRSLVIKSDGTVWEMGGYSSTQPPILIAGGPATAPLPPSGLVASDGTLPQAIKLTWDANPNAAWYEVWRNTAKDPSSATRIANRLIVPNFLDTSVSVDTLYYYWIKAVNSAGSSVSSTGDGGFSSTAEGAAKAKQMIYFPALTAYTYGDAVTLSAEATSHLPVQLSVVSGPATIDGALLTITGAGSITIRASQVGNDVYDAAPDVIQNFMAGKAILNVTADNKSKALGTPNPTLTISYQGFENGDTATMLDSAPTVATTADVSSPVGSYPITLTGGSSANYTLVLQNGTLTVDCHGYYFGNLASGGGWAMYVSPDQSAVFLAYRADVHRAVFTKFTIDSHGHFTGSGTEIEAGASIPSLARALSVDSTGLPSANSTGASLNLSGQISAGAVTAQIDGVTGTLTGQLDQTNGSVPNGIYAIPAIGTTSGGAYAIVAPSGQALVVTATNGYVEGGIGTVNGNGQVTITTSDGARIAATIDDSSQSASLTLTPSGSASSTQYSGLIEGVASTARLVNIASRADGGTGNNVAIGGFGIAGSGTKRLLLRAVGPTLATQGLGQAEVMADPTIELHDALNGNRVVTSIDNWGDNADPAVVTAMAATVGAAALSGSDAKSAATLLNLPPGVYTFVASGKNATSGIVLIEVYDADGSIGTASLVNISTRAYCSTGNNVTIGGFAVNGNAPKHLLLRAVGPTLATQGLGVGEVLADPVIEVHDTLHNNAVVATNDNWGDNANSSDITAAGARVGATPLATGDTKSSAMLITLQPGVYSFVASGKNGTSGIVLVEVYDAD